MVACKLAGTLVDSTAYNSFPKTTFIRTRSDGAQAFNIPFGHLVPIPGKPCASTEVFKGNSISVSRKREHTASDSDTESPRKPRQIPTTRSAILPMKAVSRPRTMAGPSKLSRMSTIATSHALPSGPGWEVSPRSEQDGLDEMISGIVNGTVDQRALSEDVEDGEEDVADKDEEDGTLANPDADADRFRCGQKHDGASNAGPNEWLAKKFDDMHDMYQGVQGKNAFAIRQYMQAASILRRTLYPIRSGAEARKIKGVGQGMADRVRVFGMGNMDVADSRLTNSLPVLREDYFTKTMNRREPLQLSKTSTVWDGRLPMNCTSEGRGRWTISRHTTTA